MAVAETSTVQSNLVHDAVQAMLEASNEMRLHTNCSGIPCVTKRVFVADEQDRLYFSALRISPEIEQLVFNPNVSVTIEGSKTDTTGSELEIQGRASILSDADAAETAKKQLIAADATIEPQMQHPLAKIVQIVPTSAEVKTADDTLVQEYPQNRPSLPAAIFGDIGRTLLYWLRFARAPFFTASIVPIMLGTAVASYHGVSFNALRFWLAMLGIVLIQAGANIMNDFFDHTSRNDEYNMFFSPFNGGSRTIQHGLATPSKVFAAGVVTLGAGAAIGLYLNHLMGDYVILLIGIAGGILAFFYSADPFRLSYKTLGDASIFVAFGPIPVLGAYYLQTGQLDWMPLLASIPVGIMVALILFINSFQDRDADEQADKKTSIVRLGKRRATWVYILAVIVAYASIVAIAVTYSVWWVLMACASVLLMPKTILSLRRHFDDIIELLPANQGTIMFHLVTGVLLAVGFWVS